MVAVMTFSELAVYDGPPGDVTFRPAMVGRSLAAVCSAGAQAPHEEKVEQLQLQRRWSAVVWNDPVNLMSYVEYVFVTYFGFSRAKAQELMLKVHNEGRAAVSTGTREAIEMDVRAMHEFGLQATIRPEGS